jgi:AraC-like DNA-binding protein
MKTIVFLGPSLPVAEARRHLDALYLPPAAQADVISAVMQHKPDAIVLIDGLFGQTLSVWHKEILFALDRGIAFFGAASMGALRALETEAFGAVAFGEIVQMYRDGEIEDDDEVVLAHGAAEDGYRAYSQPMVNLRKSFAAAEAAGVIDAATHLALVSAAKARFFPERTYPAIFADAGLAARQRDELTEFLQHGAIDIKRQDTIALLGHVANLTVPPPRVPFVLAHTHYLDTLYQRDRHVEQEDGRITLADIANHAAVHRRDFAEIQGGALDRKLLQILAQQLGAVAGDGEIANETIRFGRRHGLDGAEQLAGWCRRNHLEAHEFDALMRECATRRKLHEWLVARRFYERTSGPVLDELRLRGLYEETARDAAFFDRVAALHFGEPGLAPTIDLDRLVLDHIRDLGLPIDIHYSEWAVEMGFRDVYDLRIDLMRSRMVRKVLSDVAQEALAAVDA